MFRYLGFAWDDSQPAGADRAQRLVRDMQARADWTVVLERGGLRVFATGTSSRANGAYPLGDDQGVVLGKLFQRGRADSPPSDVNVFGSRDAERVRSSGGHALVRDYWGRYVAFLRTASGSTCVLRDPSGTLPCFWVRHDGVAIVFSWIEDILPMLSAGESPRVSWDAIAAFLLWGTLGGRETALEGVSQVLPGEVVDLATGHSTLLWNAVDIARSPTTHTGAEAEVLLRDTVHASVRAWASCYDTILLRLSGGIDSSILLSALSPGTTHTDVLCVNYHSPGSDSDERSYARLAAARVGRDLIERERDPGFRIDRVLTMARTPVPLPYAGSMNATTDAALARAHSAAALFTGAGGDPLFFEYPRWWPAADYLQEKGFDAGFLPAGLDAARLGRVSVWRAIAFAIAERMLPHAAARERAFDVARLVGHGILDLTIDRARFTHPELARAQLPLGKQMQTASLMHPLGYYDPFERSFAPERVNPLLSQPLVELCLGLPTYLLTQGGHGRALARRAFASDLPAAIINRRSKGGMDEHLRDVLLANLDFTRGILIDGELVRRGLLDRALVEELLSGRPTARTSPLSQVHAWIGIEAWVRRWPR